ncbi:MAG: MerR family transcriptional regulator [Gaiellaceae bacterium]
MEQGRDGLLPIGRFAFVTGLTHRALRLYGERGLLAPAYVEDTSGYRYYAPQQVRVGELIRRLREADLPLDEVRLAIAEPERLPNLLEGHERRLLARIVQTERALALLRFLREKEEGVTVSPEIREVPQRFAAVVEAQTALDRIGADLPRAYGELMEALGKAGMAPAGPALAGYPDADFDPEAFLVVAGFPIDREPPAGAVRTREFPGGRAVVATVHGPYDGISQGWQQVWAWLGEQGLKVRAMPYEVYRVDHLAAASPQEMETDLVLPVD